MLKIRPSWWPLVVVVLVLVLIALSSRRPARVAAATSPETARLAGNLDAADTAAESVSARGAQPTGGNPDHGGAAAARRLRSDLQVAIETRQETQRTQEAWDEEQAELVARYRQLQAEVDYLDERRDAEQARLQALEERNRELERRLVESEILQESLEDTLRRVVHRLTVAVANDLPFLPDERDVRLRSVHQELARPEIEAAEKLRRVLEALLVEAQYGGTVEVYRDRIVVGADSLHADVLRLGSLALYWRTPDGSRIGFFDEADAAWTDLPGRYHRNVRHAIEMATRRRPMEIIGLPLGEVTP
jgi:hypothetical protein